jgi:ubiquinol-cytochrome c reductase cytochrome c1 subunit
MKKLFTRGVLVVGLLAGTGTALAAGDEIPIESWPAARAREFSSLQNGARLFVNYCMGCHSAGLVRWNRLEQIGLDDKQIKEFLIFGNQKVGDTMRIAMTPAEAKVWFGKVPPDLSVIARARTSFEYKGTDYIYTLLRGYYRDNSTPTGWNNIAYPNIGMPHILWDRQGPREATLVHTHRHVDPKTRHESYVQTTTVYSPDGQSTQTDKKLPGAASEGFSYAFKPLDPQQARDYDADVADLVGFLAFITDPSRYSRIQIGVWVLVFLALFTLFAWRLNSVYWKDIK